MSGLPQGTEPDAKICAGYVRVSSPQPDIIQSRRPGYRPRQEHSIDNQRQTLQTWHKQLGIAEPLVFFIDDESGARRNRPELRRLISEWVERGRVGSILLRDDARAGRDKMLVEALMSLCYLRSIDVFIATWGRRIDWSNPMDRMALRASAAMNELQRRQLIRLSRDGSLRALGRGVYVGRPPYGYLHDEKKKLAHDPVEFPIVLRMKEEILTSGCVAIAKRLEIERRADVSQGRHQDRPWRPSDIQACLQNPLLTGHIVRNWLDPKTGRPTSRETWKIYPTAHPAVMTWEEYDRIQAVIASRRLRPCGLGLPGGAVGTPYSRLVFCGHHGRTMSAQRHRRRGGGKWLLFCKDFNCPNCGIPLLDIENSMNTKIQEELPNLIETGGLQRIAVDRLKAQLEELQSFFVAQAGELRGLARMESQTLEKFASGKLDERELQQALEDLRTKQDALRKESARLQANCWAHEKLLEDVLDKRGALEKLCLGLADLSDEAKRELLAKTVRAIRVFERGRLEVEWLPCQGEQNGTRV